MTTSPPPDVNAGLTPQPIPERKGPRSRMVEMHSKLDEALDIAVDGLRDFGYSWGEIARRTGTSAIKIPKIERNES